MMPLLLVIFFAEVCTQQLEEILYPTESGFSFIGKGTNPDCGIWQEKKGSGTFDSTSTAHSFLTGFVPGQSEDKEEMVQSTMVFLRDEQGGIAHSTKLSARAW
jgi:hypothetical protein